MLADHEILTLREACKLLHLHRVTLYKLAKAGKIPGFRVGSDWRLRKDVIMRWIADRTRS